MKISDLVKTINNLNKLNFDAACKNIADIQKQLDISSISADTNFLNLKTDIESDLIKVQHSIDSTLSKINDAKKQASIALADAARPYYISGNIIDNIPNVEDLDYETTKSLRGKIFSDELNYKILSSIRINTKSIYPALELRCGEGYWTKHMVAADPFYLVDIHPEFLDTAVKQFPPEYQRRVRTYLLGYDGLAKDDLKILPQGQFGFILSVNVFDFFTLDRIENYLKQIFNLLRPGGVIFFTYNNCEEVVNAVLAEKGFKGWATKTHLEKFCIETGFEILDSVSGNETSTMEIKKPGTLRTVKLQQALGEIIFNNN